VAGRERVSFAKEFNTENLKLNRKMMSLLISRFSLRPFDFEGWINNVRVKDFSFYTH
jgi:hypothetical protein